MLITFFGVALTVWEVYLLAMTLVSFLYMGIDKGQAAYGGRRVPEKTLWLLALFGGSLGILLGMNVFRHKTRKVAFQLPFVLIVLLQVGGYVWLVG